jgi:hypothetical protein
MEAQSAQKISAGFEKKYPFLKLNATRIGSERMATRLIAEALVFEGTLKIRDASLPLSMTSMVLARYDAVSGGQR